MYLDNAKNCAHTYDEEKRKQAIKLFSESYLISFTTQNQLHNPTCLHIDSLNVPTEKFDHSMTHKSDNYFKQIKL